MYDKASQVKGLKSISVSDRDGVKFISYRGGDGKSSQDSLEAGFALTADQISKLPHGACNSVTAVYEDQIVVHVNAYPLGYMETGGPEALHQLCDMLERHGAEAYMLYLGPMENIWELDLLVRTGQAEASLEAMIRSVMRGGGVTERYSYLSCRLADRLPSGPCEVLVLPEVWTRYVDVIAGVRRVIWWLSVDNNGRGFQQFSRADIHHITNSHYGLAYLREMGVERARLVNDYIVESSSFTKSLPPPSTCSVDKENIVAFNPRKGLDVMMRVIAGLQLKSWSEGEKPVFVPVQNLKSSASLLKIAKIYLDFGHHPGQDKIPREAAMAGCVVITNRQGSANFIQDVPLPDMFKFQDPTGDIDRLHLLLRLVLANHSGYLEHMREYVRMVRWQEEEMLAATSMLIKDVFDDIDPSIIAAGPHDTLEDSAGRSRATREEAGAGGGGEEEAGGGAGGAGKTGAADSPQARVSDNASSIGPVGCPGSGIDEDGCVLAVWAGTRKGGGQRECRAVGRDCTGGGCAMVSSMPLVGRLHVPGVEEEMAGDVADALGKDDFCDLPMIVIRNLVEGEIRKSGETTISYSTNGKDGEVEVYLYVNHHLQTWVNDGVAVFPLRRSSQTLTFELPAGFHVIMLEARMTCGAEVVLAETSVSVEVWDFYCSVCCPLCNSESGGERQEEEEKRKGQGKEWREELRKGREEMWEEDEWWQANEEDRRETKEGGKEEEGNTTQDPEGDMIREGEGSYRPEKGLQEEDEEGMGKAGEEGLRKEVEKEEVVQAEKAAREHKSSEGREEHRAEEEEEGKEQQRGAKGPAEVVAAIVVFNQVDMLSYQVESIQTHFQEQTEILVVINSPLGPLRHSFLSVCKLYGVRALIPPHDPSLANSSSGSVASRNHSQAVNWLWRNVILPEYPRSIFVLLDPDVFPLGPVSIRSRLLPTSRRTGREREEERRAAEDGREQQQQQQQQQQGEGEAYLCQMRGLLAGSVRCIGECEKGSFVVFMLPWLMYVDLPSLPDPQQIHFSPDVYKGVQLDSGGGLAEYFDRHHALEVGKRIGKEEEEEEEEEEERGRVRVCSMSSYKLSPELFGECLSMVPNLPMPTMMDGIFMHAQSLGSDWDVEMIRMGWGGREGRGDAESLEEEAEMYSLQKDSKKNCIYQ
ncbi:hypothetical protein GUITHDRAFT_104197 [Guillardia theta CCMP2712]|uniref:Uncharacterized protein n=1 Tax=Guillardia theta (strain CCMP2712) TaxID=905079 RepID=L1JN02_GUITC|nr:hypothetical protein GUITHDRAFT_104197 [Guillardia theta CCMP2712]EKX49802.1 hypothetical protein GUITHDRAFT_104197 [Guillardia theta CCMP2712]|eukprot:XP_005836782.1 hypothetical protein GUITHDRAFT_104197 [Guillardia theta CCMP2712]